MLNGFYIPAPAKFGNLEPFDCPDPSNPICDSDGGGGPTQSPPPNWAVGTFYGYDDAGTLSTLTISAGGTILQQYGSNTNHGFTDGVRIYIESYVGQLVQTANGFSTVGISDGGLVTAYSRLPVSNNCASATCPAGSNPALINGVCQCISAVNQQGDNSGVVCTTDAKVCPNGASVGRNPNNNCEFYPCPTSGNNNNNTDNTVVNVIDTVIETAKANPLYLAIGAGALIFLLLPRD